MTNLNLSINYRLLMTKFLIGASAIMVIGLYTMVFFDQDKSADQKSLFTASYNRPAAPQHAKDSLISIKSYTELKELFESSNYKLKPNDDGCVVVPRIYLSSLPKDFNRKAPISSHKDTFLRSLLPLILDANHEVMRERKVLVQLKEQDDRGEKLSLDDRLWLKELAAKYKVKRVDFDSLLKRVDIVPPSMALAQAIEETGWGRSHAARLKNSTFGVTLSQGVKKYDNLYESVRGYVLNLNSNAAYKSMRQIRHDLRNQSTDLCSIKLMQGLVSYSELRKAYINKITGIIRRYDLKRFDTAQLQNL